MEKRIKTKNSMAKIAKQIESDLRRSLSVFGKGRDFEITTGEFAHYGMAVTVYDKMYGMMSGAIIERISAIAKKYGEEYLYDINYFIICHPYDYDVESGEYSYTPAVNITLQLANKTLV